LFSLLLTLFVVPAVYSYLSSKHKKAPLELMDQLEPVNFKALPVEQN
jgi:hypothetical protein